MLSNIARGQISPENYIAGVLVDFQDANWLVEILGDEVVTDLGVLALVDVDCLEEKNYGKRFVIFTRD